ncbi:hypothetical protein CLF_102365 [Clonorchis sinensis]|uniref:Uncharacterized protein n=1 Tax=Clonorchis sinensis TaxID=79923 RepID=G7Y7R7_CLOSI|nr:hypothetical protein CLF_102365 [Clonorchis sinensis]
MRKTVYILTLALLKLELYNLTMMFKRSCIRRRRRNCRRNKGQKFWYCSDTTNSRNIDYKRVINGNGASITKLRTATIQSPNLFSWSEPLQPNESAGQALLDSTITHWNRSNAFRKAQVYADQVEEQKHQRAQEYTSAYVNSSPAPFRSKPTETDTPRSHLAAGYLEYYKRQGKVQSETSSLTRSPTGSAKRNPTLREINRLTGKLRKPSPVDILARQDSTQSNRVVRSPAETSSTKPDSLTMSNASFSSQSVLCTGPRSRLLSLDSERVSATDEVGSANIKIIMNEILRLPIYCNICKAMCVAIKGLSLQRSVCYSEEESLSGRKSSIVFLWIFLRAPMAVGRQSAKERLLTQRTFRYSNKSTRSEDQPFVCLVRENDHIVKAINDVAMFAIFTWVSLTISMDHPDLQLHLRPSGSTLSPPQAGVDLPDVYLYPPSMSSIHSARGSMLVAQYRDDPNMYSKRFPTSHSYSSMRDDELVSNGYENCYFSGMTSNGVHPAQKTQSTIHSDNLGVEDTQTTALSYPRTSSLGMTTKEFMPQVSAFPKNSSFDFGPQTTRDRIHRRFSPKELEPPLGFNTLKRAISLNLRPKSPKSLGAELQSIFDKHYEMTGIRMLTVGPTNPPRSSLDSHSGGPDFSIRNKLEKRRQSCSVALEDVNLRLTSGMKAAISALHLDCLCSDELVTKKSTPSVLSSIATATLPCMAPLRSHIPSVTTSAVLQKNLKGASSPMRRSSTIIPKDVSLLTKDKQSTGSTHMNDQQATMRSIKSSTNLHEVK